MKKMSLLLSVLFCLSYSTQAQVDNFSFTNSGTAGLFTAGLNDYQALGVNPANIGFQDENVAAIGLLQGGYTVYTGGMDRSQLNDIQFAEDNVSIYPSLRQSLSESFVNEGINLNLDLLLAGVAINATENLSIGLSWSIHGSFRSQFSEFASQYYFNGYNVEEYFDEKTTNTNGDTIGISNNPQGYFELVEGTRMNAHSIMPINLGVAYEFDNFDDFVINAGIGLKYISGIAGADINTELPISEGYLSYPEGAPFGLGNSNEEFQFSGSGFGFDLGGTFIYDENLTIGLSIVDLGSITWSENVERLKNEDLDTVRYDGARNFNLINQLDRSTDGIGLTVPTDESVQQALPAKLRFGASYEAVENLRLGLDLVIPLNSVAGNYNGLYAGVGGQYKLESGFKLSSGFSYSQDFGFNMPLGVGYAYGEYESYEIGVSVRDLISLVATNNPTTGYSVGFLRFKF